MLNTLHEAIDYLCSETMVEEGANSLLEVELSLVGENHAILE